MEDFENPNKIQQGYDSSKKVESKSGFEVTWLNFTAIPDEYQVHDGQEDKKKPGIYIGLTRPDGVIKEEDFFEFGEKDKAQAKLEEHRATLKEWGEL